MDVLGDSFQIYNSEVESHMKSHKILFLHSEILFSYLFIAAREIW